MTELICPLGVLRSKVVVRTYPRDDEDFRALVVERLRRFDRVRHVAAIPGRLEVLLREDYPLARSRYQDSLASSGGMPLLYVFRDGAFVNEAAIGEAGDRAAVARAAGATPDASPTADRLPV